MHRKASFNQKFTVSYYYVRKLRFTQKIEYTTNCFYSKEILKFLINKYEIEPNPFLKSFNYFSTFHTHQNEKKITGTGKSFLEALILASVKYEERLFIEFHEKYKLTTCCQLCTNIVLNVKTKTKKQFLYTTCCQLVFFLEFNEQSLVKLWVN